VTLLPLLCVVNPERYSYSKILETVELDGNTAATIAVTCGMAGWMLGAPAIPETWLAALPRRAEVEDLASRFADWCLDQWESHGAG